VKYPRKTVLAAAIGAALLSLAGGASAAAPSNEELLKQLSALKATVEALQKQVKEQAVTLEKTREVIPEGLPQGATLATTQDVEGVRSQLEDTRYNVQRDRDFKTALSSRGLTIGGTLTGNYTSSTQAAPATSNNPSGKGAETSFGIGATLSFAGNLYKDYAEGRNLDYRLALTYATPKFANSTSTNSPSQGDTVTRLTDVYLQYKVLPDTGALEEPKLTVTFGQQKLPFGLEGQVSDELKPTVSTAQFLGDSALKNIGHRQIGLVLRGDVWPTADYGFGYRAPLFEYALGVVNGNGENTTDENNRKDFVGRATFTVPSDYNSWLRQLTFGLSYYDGWANLTNSTPAVVLDHGHTIRKGFDVTYNHNPIGFTYELADGSDDQLLSTTQPVTNHGTKYVHKRGQVATLFYNFGDIAQWSKNLNNVGKFDDFWPTTSQIYYRYDTWDPNRAARSDVTLKQTIGYNLFFAQTTKLQLGATRTQYDKGLAKPNAWDLTAQFQYGF
jgi:hypothetical protein